MKMFIPRPASILFFISVALLSLAGLARAATVGPAGYTNDFSVRPPASDWATLSLAGGAGDVYDLDNEVLTNLNINATLVSLVTVSNNNNPATQLTNATWSSNANGLYLQTRPNLNRATLLMGKFVNGTATNAAEIRLAYQLTMAGPLSIEDAMKLVFSGGLVVPTVRRPSKQPGAEADPVLETAELQLTKDLKCLFVGIGVGVVIIKMS